MILKNFNLNKKVQIKNYSYHTSSSFSKLWIIGAFYCYQENLKALHARDQAANKEAKQREEEERQRILREGGNPDEILLIRKRIEEFERQKTYVTCIIVLI